AQQECSSSLFAPFGSSNLGRLKSATVINMFIGVIKISKSVALERGYRKQMCDCSPPFRAEVAH
ncbi:hypothetical protein CUA51_25285, partial [Shigella boydii]